MAAVEHFAQRLRNPFRGAMHTIRYEAAEAVTLDSVHWDIYVSNDFLLEGLNVNHWFQITVPPAHGHIHRPTHPGHRRRIPHRLHQYARRERSLSAVVSPPHRR